MTANEFVFVPGYMNVKRATIGTKRGVPRHVPLRYEQSHHPVRNKDGGVASSLASNPLYLLHNGSSEEPNWNVICGQQNRRKNIITQSSGNKPARSSDMLSHRIVLVAVPQPSWLLPWEAQIILRTTLSTCARRENILVLLIEKSLWPAGRPARKRLAPPSQSTGGRPKGWLVLERETTCCTTLDWLSGCTRLTCGASLFLPCVTGTESTWL